MNRGQSMKVMSIISKNGTLSLTWPIFVELLLKALVGYLTVFVLSRFSDDAVVAVAVSNQINYMNIILYGVVNTGTIITISQLLGAKRRDYTDNVISASIFFNLVVGCICSVFLLAFSKKILIGMGLDGQILIYGVQYLSITGAMSFIQAVSTTVAAIIRSFKYTKITMYIMLVVNILNVIGACISVLRPFGIQQFGVKGVAISAVVSQCIGLVIFLVILRYKIGTKFNIHFFSSQSKEAILKIYRFGVPSAGEALASHISQLVITSIISLLGSEALITKIYTFNLMVFIMLISNSIGQTTQIIIGHYIGESKVNEAYTACLKNLKYAASFSACIAIVFAIFSEQLLGLFTENQMVIEMGKKLLLIAIILEIGRSFNFVLVNALKGTGDVKFPAIVGVITMWGGGVLFAYILGVHFNFGLIGIWISYCLDECIRGAILLLRWKSKNWVPTK